MLNFIFCVFALLPLIIERLNDILVLKILGSIVVSIPACHAGDRGSIPRRGGQSFWKKNKPCRLREF
jgi:hypothetical protein